MKRILLTGIVLAAFIQLFAGKGITVTQKYSGPDSKNASVNVTWVVSETQCKMKMNFQDADVNTNTTFIPNLNTGKLITYTESDLPANMPKVYFELPVQNIKPVSEMNASRVSVTRTGETKNISGFKCEKLVVKTNRNTTEMWVTTDFNTNYYKFYPFFQNSFALMGLSEESIQGFPLESVTKDNGGNVVSSYELVSASLTEINGSEFNAPADYKSAEEVSKAKK